MWGAGQGPEHLCLNSLTLLHVVLPSLWRSNSSKVLALHEILSYYDSCSSWCLVLWFFLGFHIWYLLSQKMCPSIISVFLATVHKVYERLPHPGLCPANSLPVPSLLFSKGLKHSVCFLPSTHFPERSSRNTLVIKHTHSPREAETAVWHYRPSERAESLVKTGLFCNIVVLY